MIDAVIFDMDGTLVDSETVSAAAWHATGERLGAHVTDEFIRSLIGRNRAEGLQLACAQFGGDEELAARAVKLRADIFNEMAARELNLMPGAHEALAALKDAGFTLALATSTYREFALPRLERFGLQEYFATITCGDEVSRSKPEPDIFLAAAASIGVDPAHCAAIEDSHNGVRSGHAAGMHVFMVPDMLPPTEEIAAMCDVVLDSLHELPAAIEARR